MATLLDCKAYLIARGRASLQDVALRLDTSVEAARGMIEVWGQKNKVRPVAAVDCAKARGGSCCCGTDAPGAEVYEWIGPPAPGPGH